AVVIGSVWTRTGARPCGRAPIHATSAAGLDGLERGHPLVVGDAGRAAAVAAVGLGCLPEGDRVVERLVVHAVERAEVLDAVRPVGLVQLATGLGVGRRFAEVLR